MLPVLRMKLESESGRVSEIQTLLKFSWHQKHLRPRIDAWCTYPKNKIKFKGGEKELFSRNSLACKPKLFVTSSMSLSCVKIHRNSRMQRPAKQWNIFDNARAPELSGW